MDGVQLFLLIGVVGGSLAAVWSYRNAGANRIIAMLGDLSVAAFSLYLLLRGNLSGGLATAVPLVIAAWLMVWVALSYRARSRASRSRSL
jgi:hypothetical protein